jgi:putative ABC transport system permease protein
MSADHPPPLAERLLAALLGPGDWADSIAGDLHEEHAARRRQTGRVAAALWYWAQAVRIGVRKVSTRAAAAVRPNDIPEMLPTTHGDSLMRTIGLETRHALRAMFKRPATTGIVVLTLSLGLGANAAIFAMIDALVIRPYHFPDSDRITLVSLTNPDGSDDRRETTSPADFLDWRPQADAIQHLTAMEWWNVNLVGRDEPEAVQGFHVSHGFFAALGVNPVLGRGFLADEETQGRHYRAVLGYGLWQRRFGGDPSIVGQKITIDAMPYEVVGVAPQGFEFPMGSQVWAPLSFNAETAARRNTHYLTIIGRLAPGRSIEDARSQLALITDRIAHQQPKTNKGRTARVHTLAQGMMDQGLGPILSLWQASALFVLLIACANIANLLLARGAERQREIAVRLAIGASRPRIVRQLLIENILLGLAAVPGAMLAAYVGLRVLVAYMPARIARFVAGWHGIDVDGRLLLVTGALAMITAVVFGLLPALHTSRPRLAESLKDGGRSMSHGGRNHVRRVLVVAEMALALPLLVASGLSAIGVNRFLNGPQGYDPDNLLAMQAELPDGKYPKAPDWLRFTNATVDRLAALPGVTAAAAFNVIPAATNNSGRGIEIEGKPPQDPDNLPTVDYRVVTPRAFDVLPLPITQGRGFSDADREGSQLVAIVSESLARRYWPGEDPIGRRLRIARGDWLTVVGVSGDHTHDWFNRRNYPTLYRPYAQAPTSYLAFLIRTAGEPGARQADARAAVAAVDREQPVYNVMTMRELLKERTLGMQYVAVIMAVFGSFALILAVVGVYSVMAYLVTQRTHEIGVRMALGATPSDVIRLTVGQTGRLTLVGVVVGGLLAIASGRLIEAGLVGSVSSDPRLVAAVAAVLVLAALAAGYIPARRAASIDPNVALRAE